MEANEVLRRFPFFGALSPNERGNVVRAAQSLDLPGGAAVYHEGDDCRHLALVGEGSIRVYKASESGREITLYHVGAGQCCLVNMLCVLLGRPATASARAEEAVTAVLLPARVFRGLVERHDAVRQFAFESMGLRLVDVMTLTGELAFRRMDERIADHLAHRFGAGAPQQELSVTHEEIAAELGTAREVVSRLLKDLERTGAVTLARGRILLRDAGVLRQVAQGGRNVTLVTDS